MTELTKAYNAAQTTLNNSINAFNQWSFNKFVENVVDDTDDGESRSAFGGAPGENPLDQTSPVLGDLRGEDEKLAEALEIALAEVRAAREEKQAAKAAQDEEGGDGQ